MRLLVVSLSLCLSAVPACSGEAISFEVAANLPCRAYLAIEPTELSGLVVEPLQEFMSKQTSKSADVLMSECIVNDYIVRACKSQPTLKVGDVIATLERQQRTHSLPPARRCGA